MLPDLSGHITEFAGLLFLVVLGKLSRAETRYLLAGVIAVLLWPSYLALVGAAVVCTFVRLLDLVRG